MVDEGSRHFRSFILSVKPSEPELGNSTWKEIEDPFINQWIAGAPGKPSLVRLDPEGCFKSNEFKTGMTSMGIGVDQTPGEAHWKNGIAEAMIKVAKETATKLARRDSSLSPQTLFSLASSAHDDSYFHRGFWQGHELRRYGPIGCLACFARPSGGRLVYRTATLNFQVFRRSSRDFPPAL